MGVMTVPYKPTPVAATKFEGQTVFQRVGADAAETLNDVVTAALALVPAPVLKDPKGVKADVAATAEDVCSIRVSPIACDNLDVDGNTVTVDYIYLDGNTNTKTGGLIDEEEGGVDLTRALQIPTGAAVDVTICWCKAYEKAEYAALA